jgi:2-polyprenyl-3-methyl-5-hydroxy-6-metoxy-1,4-benzoquinol methylase
MVTLDYYNNNAKKYFDTTVTANMSRAYNMFLKYVIDNGLILDFGCGSGRDSKYFLEKGYRVECIDGSLELSKLASEYLGINVNCMDFFEFSEFNKYDGVWACASLLHVKREKLLEILIKIRDSLKENGILYVSFKDGTGEEIVDGKYYNYLTYNDFLDIINIAGNLELLEFDNSKTVLNNTESRTWNNFVLIKR